MYAVLYWGVIYCDHCVAVSCRECVAVSCRDQVCIRYLLMCSFLRVFTNALWFVCMLSVLGCDIDILCALCCSELQC